MMSLNVLSMNEFVKTGDQIDRLSRDESLQWFQRYYSAVFGNRCPPVAIRDCMSFLERGAKLSLIRSAIDAASVAARPSWQYARAIIGNCIATGYFDSEGFERRQRDFWAHSPDNKWDDLYNR